jgi:hypothetical protein
MRQLSLDPATWTGFAFGEHGTKPFSGLIKLPGDMSRAGKATVLEGRVRDLISGNRVEHVVLEDVYAMTGKAFSMDQQKLLHSFRCAIEMACFKCGLTDQHMTFVMPGAWRKTFGISEVPAIVRRGKKGNVRKWLKQAAIERCHELGWPVDNDNEADALGLWAYGESLFDPAIGITRTPLFATLEL